jgi:uncharacterized membrane protein
MQDFIFFLGRFHVLALHLPIGMVIIAVLLDWLTRGPRRNALAAAIPFVWGATALSAVVTVVLGYMHFAEGGFTGPSASAHRLYGTIVAVACLGIWLLSATAPVLHRRVNLFTGILVLALVTITGHYGGNLTHGSEYLVEYAPRPLRALAGLPERRPPVTDIASADPWHDIVQPMLESRCAGCHNDDKRNGELSVVDYDALMRGGETGRVVSAGNAEVSELYRRVTLSDDDDAFMPAEGKTPLTAAQVEILRWWIDAEAPIDTTVAAVGAPAEITGLLSAEVGLAAAGASAVSDMRSAETAAADAALVDTLFEAGFLVRRVSQSDPRLAVSIHSVGNDLDAAQLAALRTAADSIASLDLQSAGLDDAALANFDAFGSLTSLRVSNNEIGDAGVVALQGLANLEVLNLYGNAAISDASVDALASLTSLQSLYVWNTGITPAGIARLREQRPGLEVHGAAAGFAPP